MATTTTNFGWTVPSDTDLVKDGAAAIRTALGGVDTSFVDLKGGTTGQVLSKASGTDLDFTWVAQDDSNAIQNAIVDAKGDLIAATGADTPARLPVGTNGYVLTADSAEATGLKWAAASAGKVAQVLSTTKTDTFTTTSTSYTDITGLSVSITPSSSTSKIMVFVTVNGQGVVGANQAFFQLVRDTTPIGNGAAAGSRSVGFGGRINNNNPDDVTQVSTINHLDSPSSTSSLTYKVQTKTNGGGTNYINRSQTDTDSAAYIRLSSSITVMEILA